MKRFEGRTAIVTGAGKNIGKEIALAFAKEGANVVVCDVDPETTKKTAAEVRACGVEAMEMICDVRDRKKVFEYSNEAIKKFGKIDYLVNNAGGSAGLINKLTKFVDAEEETLDYVLDINIKGTINCTQAVLQHMIDNRYGKIINMASIAGTSGMINRVDYSTAKGGIISMCKALAMEVGRYNVLVNCISPGAIERNGNVMTKMTYLGEEGKSGHPRFIAETALFLAQSDYITGENIVVDGGRTLGPITQEILYF